MHYEGYTSLVISHHPSWFLTYVLQRRLKYLIRRKTLSQFLTTKTVPPIPRAQYSSNVIYISYPQESFFVCHTVEAYAKVESASQSSQAVPHCASLKLLNALLILMLPWLHLVNPAFVSLWMDSSDSPASLFQHVCLLVCIWNPLQSRHWGKRMWAVFIRFICCSKVFILWEDNKLRKQ